MPETTTSTTTRIGQFQFHNFSDGVSGTTTQIGQFGFTSLSNGEAVHDNQDREPDPYYLLLSR